ncbi:MAG: hydrolase, partial [Thermoplasmata archaeon]
FGEARVRELAAPVLGAEDFSRYLEQVPGTFWFLGGAPPRGGAGPLHSSRFAPDEESLLWGSEALVRGVEALQRPERAG